jgi:hypothetical protein
VGLPEAIADGVPLDRGSQRQRRAPVPPTASEHLGKHLAVPVVHPVVADPVAVAVAVGVGVAAVAVAVAGAAAAGVAAAAALAVEGVLPEAVRDRNGTPRAGRLPESSKR